MASSGPGWGVQGKVRVAQGHQKEGLPPRPSLGPAVTSVDLGWRQGCGEEPLPGQAGPPADTSSRAVVQTLSWEEFLFQVRRLQGTMPTARRPPVTQSKGLSLSGAMAQFSRRLRCQWENTGPSHQSQTLWECSWLTPQPPKGTDLTPGTCNMSGRAHTRLHVYGTPCENILRMS